MVMVGKPEYDPVFFMSIHQCRDCGTDPPECTDEIKRSCPFYYIRNDQEEQEADQC